jgi:hypothetical protein
MRAGGIHRSGARDLDAAFDAIAALSYAVLSVTVMAMATGSQSTRLGIRFSSPHAVVPFALF